MGCQSSRSALVNATTARLEAAKQDDISIEGDELPVSVSVCHPCSQLYLSLVPTDAPQRSEITSLLGLLKSSGALGEIEDAIASVGACYSTVSTLSDQISEALVRDVRTFQPGGCGLQVDLIKAYSIFVWVSTNIEYDCKAWEDLLKDLPTPSINPENVLSTKRSICSGYAALYSALASEVGLESLVIDGHFKISRALQSNGPLAEFAPSHLNTHAWNRVKLGDTWHLLDCTYAAGQTTASGFKKHFNRLYFATPPERMVLTHWPENSDNQLLETPLLLEQVKNFLPLIPDIFTCGVVLDEMKECFTIEPTNSKPVLELSLQLHASEREIVAKLENWQPMKADTHNESEHSTHCYIDYQRPQVCLLVAVPSKGIYTLKLFTKSIRSNDGCPHSLTHMATYLVLCAVDSEAYIGYPRIDQETADRFDFSLVHWNGGTQTHIAECPTGELEMVFRATPSTSFSHYIVPGSSDEITPTNQFHYFSCLSYSSADEDYNLHVIFSSEGLWTVCLDVCSDPKLESECVMRYEVHVLKKARKLSYPWVQASCRVSFPNSKPLHASGNEILHVPFVIEGDMDLYPFLTKNASSAEKMDQFAICVADEEFPNRYMLKVIFPEPGKWLVHVYGRHMHSKSLNTKLFCLFFEVEECLKNLIFPQLNKSVAFDLGIKFLDLPINMSEPSFSFTAPPSLFLQPRLVSGWHEIDGNSRHGTSSYRCQCYCERTELNTVRLHFICPFQGNWTLWLFASQLSDGCERNAKFVFQVKLQTSESDKMCDDQIYPVFSPAFFLLKMSIPSATIQYKSLIDQSPFKYFLSSLQELEYRAVIHRPTSPNATFSYNVLVVPSTNHRSGNHCCLLQSVFPDEGDWVIQIFACLVNTNDFKPVVRFHINSNKPVHNQTYPVIKPSFYSKFRMTVDESMLLLPSLSYNIPGRFSVLFKCPKANVELLHHAIDQAGNLRGEATQLVPGDSPKHKKLTVELWEIGEWTIQLFARMHQQQEWTLVLQHQFKVEQITTSR